MKSKKELKHWQIVSTILIGSILIYIAWIWLWDKTSSDYEPSDSLDSQVKTPIEQQDWFVRRKNGI